MSDWQSWAALGIVALTVLTFIFRAKRRGKRKSGGCKDCGSGKCE